MSKAAAVEYAAVCKRNIPQGKRGGYEEFTAKTILDFFEEATHIVEARTSEVGPLVGFLLLVCVKNEDSSRVVLVCTSESTKGSQLSKELLDKAKRLAKAYKAKSLDLEAVNEAVATIYESQGFKRKGSSLDMTYPITGGSRLHKQTRRSHRNRRNLKHRKFRNLTTRRR
jgi:predicted GNAT family N-acyltransferase